ncbi:glycoside hydrolase family 35 protein [Aureobasidium subglaciale EXF-2481]|uniref:beta-galactosidase n=1 Tax=Aureobasidium subglaciale (strain EXF-2481) TaxID=1043005 RepID=A0A074YKS5_AURSE|nr:glycoside hydrolase family 35 protein [Aureobasidium subglaciale EXF-2481]KEQ98433.1 glycoside hydrolase family 35 protein [Aureobasidium subglaciale EXF-2481]
MRVSLRLLVCALLLGVIVLATDNGLTTQVTWDPYSLMVNGERLFLFSGEFAYERVPVPEMWSDIFQKFKANGFNAVSMYFFWSYHSASRDVFDFETGGKNVQKVIDAAAEAGLYLIARPGPYANAETNAGGLALWTSDGSAGNYRTSDQAYYDAWKPFMQELNKILVKNQITEGGPIILYQIENELSETVHKADNTLVLYMEQIEQVVKDSGIVVPTTSNEKGQRAQSWSTDYQDVGGAVNIYGLDSYPGGLSCTNINSGFNLVRNYYQWFQNYSSTQPEFWPEFESGYFQPWGGYFYDDCLAEHDPAFADVYYKNNIGQNGALLNLYMAMGATNWGNLAAPVVYTSYDYSAPLRETREIQSKFSQTKLIALFTRVSQDLLYTVMESNGTGNAVSTQDIWTWVLRNPNTTTGFYTTQHSKSSSRAVTDFSINLQTSLGPITVPNVQLNGRQSKIAVTDYHFGKHTLLYSSVDILTYGLFDPKAVLVLYLEANQIGEFAFSGNISVKSYGSTNVTASQVKTNGSASFTKFVYRQSAGKTSLQLSNGVLMYLLDVSTAWTFWAPPTTPNPNVGPGEQIFAIGPYLVRNASVSSNVVSVNGDNTNSTTLEVYVGDASVDTILWNGKELATKKTSYGALTADLTSILDREITIPTLSGWQVADSLPEVARDYDDSAWAVCNKTSTKAPVKPLSLPVLYSSDYGYYSGIKIYRGHFDGKSAVSANVTAQGGSAAGWSAWLNGKLVGGHPGNASLLSTSDVLDFSGVTLYDTNNVLTVVTDYTGHDETSTGKGAANPRGLLGAVLKSSGNTTATFKQWKIQGNAGGSANIDPVRGPLNEGGLYGERVGWHLPGFSPSGKDWSAGSPAQGLNSSGIKWYLTTFELDIDSDLDVPIGLELSAPAGTVASVQIYLNGYQYGKFITHIGPQTRFPFPPGIINNQGNNTIALSVWAETDAGAKLDTVSLFSYNVYETSFKFAQDWSYLQPGWTSERLQYA